MSDKERSVLSLANEAREKYTTPSLGKIAREMQISAARTNGD